MPPVRVGQPPGSAPGRTPDQLREALRYADSALGATRWAPPAEVLPGVDVQGLRQHLVDVVNAFASAAGCRTDSATLATTAECLVARFEEAPASAWESWGSADGAWWTLIGELLVHSWDLRRHADPPLGDEPAECARAALVGCAPLLVDFRRRGTVDEPQVARVEATPLDRLAAMYGRPVPE